MSSLRRVASAMPGQTDGYLPSRKASPPIAGTKLYCLLTEVHVC